MFEISSEMEFELHCKKTVGKFIQFVFKSTHLPCWFSRHTHCKKICTKVYKFFKHLCIWILETKCVKIQTTKISKRFNYLVFQYLYSQTSFIPAPKNFKFFDWIIELLVYPIIQFLWKNQETGVYRIKYNKEEKIQKKNKCL